MVFSSLEFLLRFLPAVLLLYFIVPGRFKNLILLIASLFFYAWGEPVYVALIIVSCLVNYLLGIAIDKYKGTSAAKVALNVSIVVNLLALGFFKYADFLIATINKLLGLNINFLGLSLPIGISFFTFLALSYTVDIYRGRAPVLKNPVTLAVYFSQFQRLLAGPIVRYPSIAQELDHRTHSLDLFAQGVQRFVIGLGKKVLIADTVGVIWTSTAVSANPSVLGRWLGIVAFALQIYFDFSGYSDMAIGLGCMFGFHFPENFNFPYISQSITEFWRRWHISLGQWFQVYFFNPLTRALRLRNLPTWVVILISQVGTMTLIGLWHGANWNFCLWGLYFGIVLAAEKLFLGRFLERLPKVLRHVYALLIVLVGWVIFELDSIPAILGYLGDLLALNGIDLYNPESLYIMKSNLVLLLIAIIGAVPLVKNVHDRVSELVIVRTVVMPAFYMLILVASIAYVVDSSFKSFLYFRF